MYIFCVATHCLSPLSRQTTWTSTYINKEDISSVNEYSLQQTILPIISETEQVQFVGHKSWSVSNQWTFTADSQIILISWSNWCLNTSFWFKHQENNACIVVDKQKEHKKRETWN